MSAARLQEGSWSASSSSGRAPRKLQASGDGHGPWLLFGLCCICASAAAAAAGSFAPRVLIGSPPAAAEALARRSTLPASASSSESEASHGKKVYFDYHVTGEVMTPIGDAEIGTPSFLSAHTYKYTCSLLFIAIRIWYSFLGE